MKSKLITLTATALAVGFSAWLGGGCRETSEDLPVVVQVVPPVVKRLDKWLSVMEIWQCEGGNYELKTAFEVLGEYESLEAARNAKTNRAKQVVEAERRGDFKRKVPVRPDCKRVE